jgi:hypothetical protein
MALTGCGLAVDTPPPSSPTSSPAASAPTILLARTLKLPVVDVGEPCPVTPVTSRKLDIADPRGSGPFYLGGGMPKAAFAWNKTAWELVDGARGPVLLRGGRADGAGQLQFSGSPADASDKGVTLSSGGGVSAAFYQRVIAPGPADTFYLYPSTAGCYALQVDGPSFEQIIVISAS